MSSVPLSLAKSHMNIDGTADDELITFYIGAAEAWFENNTGYVFSGQTSVPFDIQRAVLLLTAYYYEQREAIAAGISMQFAPAGVTSIARDHRKGWFGDDE